MAKKEKTSFFGKIMGGNVTDEPLMQPVSQYQEEVVEAEELAPDDACGGAGVGSGRRSGRHAKAANTNNASQRKGAGPGKRQRGMA